MDLKLERGVGMSLYGHTYININSLKRWVNSLSVDEIQSVDVGGYNLEIKDERVYGYRCSIAHAKGDVEEYIAIPNISRKIIAAEIPLVKYLAYEVIKNCSEI